MPRTPRQVISDTAKPIIDAAVDKAVGTGLRKEIFDQAVSRLPWGHKTSVDMTGWAAAEYLAYLDTPTGGQLPPPRIGRDTVRGINRLSGVLPTEAVLLARAITDTAPPAGQSANPALHDLLEKYLPESLHAFQATAPGGRYGSAEDRLLVQLRLLHDVAANIQRAEADHNERDLQIQEAFLRERFAELSPSDLDLGTREAAEVSSGGATRGDRRSQRRTGADHPAAAPPPTRPMPSVAAAQGARVYVEPDRDPVVAFGRSPASDRKVAFRLALPKGQVATLGCVRESFAGATGFQHHTNRRWLTPRHPTGFRTSQVDLALKVNVAGMRRFLVYAVGPSRPEPTRTVLFVRDGNRSQADLATLLTNQPGTATTVICTGYTTADGFMLRNESTLFPDLRSACGGFGFDRVTWLDADTPIV